MSEEPNEKILMPTGKRLVLSSSPHVSTSESVRKIMLKVLLAMLPAVAAGVWYFGWRALWIVVLCTFFCVGAEALWCRLAKKPVWGTVRDCSAAVTGVLLALNLPVSVPFYVPLIGAFLAIWLGKQVFGGLGNNPFNPALVARVGLLIAMPMLMTTWQAPRGMDKSYPSVREFRPSVDAVTCATPLGVAGQRKKLLDKSVAAKHNFSRVANVELYKRYFLGMRGGCIGETCVPALLLGGIILFAFNLINWRVPLCFVGTVAVITGAVNFFFPGVTPPAIFHLCTGGLMLGAIFMATDMVTCPITGRGCVVFAVGCGLITSVIRIWGNYPEGVSFAILFMNALVPLIDRWFTIRPFGYVSSRKHEVGK